MRPLAIDLREHLLDREPPEVTRINGQARCGVATDLHEGAGEVVEPRGKSIVGMAVAERGLRTRPVGAHRDAARVVGSLPAPDGAAAGAVVGALAVLAAARGGVAPVGSAGVRGWAPTAGLGRFRHLAAEAPAARTIALSTVERVTLRNRG